MGNQLVRDKVNSINLLDPLEPSEEQFKEWGILKDQTREVEVEEDLSEDEETAMENIDEQVDKPESPEQKSEEEPLKPNYPESGPNKDGGGQLDLGL